MEDEIGPSAWDVAGKSSIVRWTVLRFGSIVYGIYAGYKGALSNSPLAYVSLPDPVSAFFWLTQPTLAVVPLHAPIPPHTRTVDKMKFISFTTLVLASIVSARPGLKQRIPSSIYDRAMALDAIGSPSNGTNSTTPGAPANSTDPQSSFTLLQSVIATAFTNDGTSGNGSEPGITPSLTSTNNFINYCATLNLPITNGSQIKSGSCNPAPMGAIPSTSNMPSAKFVSPSNLAVIPANTTFQVALAIKGLETGFFVNPDANWYAAPQQLNMTTGNIMGHSHIVIEKLDNLTQATPTDPTKFAFFAGLNGKADANGLLYANVTSGLPEGTYRMASINVAMNHQPALVAVAQRGALDDAIYVSLSLVILATEFNTYLWVAVSSLLLLAAPTGRLCPYYQHPRQANRRHCLRSPFLPPFLLPPRLVMTQTVRVNRRRSLRSPPGRQSRRPPVMTLIVEMNQQHIQRRRNQLPPLPLLQHCLVLTTADSNN